MLDKIRYCQSVYFVVAALALLPTYSRAESQPGEPTIPLVVDGDHVEYWLNGVQQCSFTLWSEEWRALVANSKFGSMPGYGVQRKGHIALQDHGNPVWYRNIRVRRL